RVILEREPAQSTGWPDGERVGLIFPEIREKTQEGASVGALGCEWTVQVSLVSYCGPVTGRPRGLPRSAAVAVTMSTGGVRRSVVTCQSVLGSIVGLFRGRGGGAGVLGGWVVDDAGGGPAGLAADGDPAVGQGDDGAAGAIDGDADGGAGEAEGVAGELAGAEGQELEAGAAGADGDQGVAGGGGGGADREAGGPGGELAGGEVEGAVIDEGPAVADQVRPSGGGLDRRQLAAGDAEHAGLGRDDDR